MTQPPIHRVEGRERRGRRVLALVTLTALVLLTASWAALLSFVGASAAHGTLEALDQRFLPDPEGRDLALPEPSRVSRVMAEDGTILAELHAGKHSEPVALSDVPELVRQAVLAAEDAGFYEHEGIDYRAVARAAVSNARGNSRQGGSTITQQVVKQAFVGDEQTMERKVREAVFAAAVERRYEKDEIFEHYLNTVYFGYGAYGIKAAAEEYYGKDLGDLELAEAATLATLIRNPSLYDPRRRPNLAKDRRDIVLDQMAQEGFAEAEEARAARRQPVEVIEHVEPPVHAPHVVAAVKHELLNDPEFGFLGETYQERKKAVFGCPPEDTACSGGGGLRIFVTVDLGLQEQAVDLLQDWFPSSEDGPEAQLPTGAIASVDPRTGAVKVMASGLSFEQEQYDLARQGRRNPGSAFKPFALVAALESGISLSSRWDGSSPLEVDCPTICGADGSNVWTVHNYGGSDFGSITLLDAMRSSVNVVFAQIAVEVGPPKIVEVAHRMGIGSDLPEVFSIPLGTGAVSPLEMASAYGVFATNGNYIRPYIVQRIEDASGEATYEREPERHQVVDPGVAAASRQALEQVVCCGTGTAARIGRPQFGKTGTHQDYNDAWFVGGVPQLSTAVWVGFPDAQTPLRGVRIGGRYYGSVAGGSVPAPIWGQFMAAALDGVEVEDFPEPPDGAEQHFAVPTTEVPEIRDMSISDAKLAVLRAHLRPVVRVVDSRAREGTIVWQHPEPGAEVEHGTAVVIAVSSGRPPSAALPDLRGSTVPEAEAALRELVQEAGFDLSYSVVHRETDDPDLVDRVIATDPGSGAEVTEGTNVTLVVGQAPAAEEEDEEEEDEEEDEDGD